MSNDTAYRVFRVRLCATMIGAVLASTPSAIGQCGDWVVQGSGIHEVGSASAATLWDPDGAGPQSPLLVVAGFFDRAGGLDGQAVSNIAAWNGSQWQALGE